MIFENLNDANFLLYCAKHYDNPHCVDNQEFIDDIKRIKYIKKLFTRFEESGELKDRLILNHIITLNNLFGPVHLNRILFLKMSNKLHLLKPFLVFLNLLPDVVYNIGTEKTNFITNEISLDPKIIEALRKI